MTIERVQVKDSRTGVLRWRWVVDEHVHDPGGGTTRVRRYKRTKREARQVQRELLGLGAPLRNAKEGTDEKSKTTKSIPPTLAAFAPRFLAYQEAEGNSESEMASKRMILRVHLLPAFGDQRLDAITDEAIDEYRVAKLKCLRRKTINNHLAVLSRMLKLAHRWGLIEKAPHVPLMKKSEILGRPIEFLDFDEAEEFLALVRRFYPDQWLLALFALRSGLRLGEIRALQWSQIELDAGLVIVQRSFTEAAYAKDVSAGDRKEPGIRLPKWGKIRTVPLPHDVVEALRVERSQGRHRLVFPGDGRLVGGVRSKSVITKAIARAAKRGGMNKHVHVHMLRHSYASHLVMRGVSLRVVQELLGHATLEMTMRYAHLSPDHKAEAVQVLAQANLRVLDGGRGSRTGRRLAGSKGAK